jgi:hypothetical protein
LVATPHTVGHPSPTSYPTPRSIPHTGAGGAQAGNASQQVPGATTLPRAGGGNGSGIPPSPLAPLALLGAVAIVAGRLVRRRNTR